MRTDAEALASTEADLYILGSDPLILTTRIPEEGYDPAAAAFGPFSWDGKAKTGESPAAELAESPLTAGLTMKNVFFREWHPVSGGRAAHRLG